MSAKGRIKKIIKDRIDKVDDTLEKTSQLVEAIPALQQQKAEDEFTLGLLDIFPADYVEENAQKWLQIEEANNDLFSSNLPHLGDFPSEFIRTTLTTASGTATPYIASGSNLIARYYAGPEVKPDWVARIATKLTEHNNMVLLRDTIPARLNMLNPQLGDKFIEAQNSYSRCQIGVLGVDLCAIHLRDVLEQIWGGLVVLAVMKNTNPKINTNRLQLKKEGDRSLVGTLLASTTFPKARLEFQLSNMFALHR